MTKDMGASAEPTGLAGAEALEPHSPLHPSDDIPSATPKASYLRWVKLMVDGDVSRLGDHSFMIRAGLLQQILPLAIAQASAIEARSSTEVENAPEATAQGASS